MIQVPESGCLKNKGCTKGFIISLGCRLILLYRFASFILKIRRKSGTKKGGDFTTTIFISSAILSKKRFHLRLSIVIICKRKKSVKKELSAIALFLFQLGIKLEVAVMAKTRDIPIFHRLKYGTALLLGVSAFGVSAMSYVLIKFSENIWQIVERVKVEALEIDHRKAWRVGKISAFGSPQI